MSSEIIPHFNSLIIILKKHFLLNPLSVYEHIFVHNAIQFLKSYGFVTIYKLLIVKLCVLDILCPCLRMLIIIKFRISHCTYFHNSSRLFVLNIFTILRCDRLRNNI